MENPPWSHRILGVAAAVTMTTVRYLPAWISYGLAEIAAWIVVLVTLNHERKVEPLGRGLIRNQKIAFREKWNPRFSRRHLRAYSRHLTALFVDFCRLPLINSQNLTRFVNIDELDKMRPLREEGGYIAVTGHIGFWELGGNLGRLRGYKVHSLVRPLSIGPVNKVTTAIRTAGGNQVIAKWNNLWTATKMVTGGEILGIAADENVSENPIFAPFLGTLAATTPTPAILQRLTGAPIAVWTVNRIRRGRFRIHVWKIIRNEPTDDREADLQRVTEEYSEALSRAIRAYPEQWFWGSRRFRTRPPGEVPGPDGLPPVAPPKPGEERPEDEPMSTWR